MHEWSRYDAGTRCDGNGHFIQAAVGEPGVLINPVPFNEGDVDHVRTLGGVAAVILTSSSLVRNAARCAEAFSCPVFVPEASLPDVARASLRGPIGYGPDTELPVGLVAVPVPTDLSLDETALYSRSGGGTLVVGDALLGEPIGRLSLQPRTNPAELTVVARGLRVLLARRLAQVLVAHGQSVLRNPAPLLQDLLFQHDPHAYLIRSDARHWGRPQLFGKRFGSRAVEYARPLGLKVIDFELTELPPGRQNYPLHRHDAEEELFLVTEGRGEVWTDRDGTVHRVPIVAGDVLGFPPRFQIAHAIVNTGDAPLRFFSFSAPAESVEMADYPTTGARLERTPYGKYRRFYLPDHLDVPYFEGEPIDKPVASASGV